MKKIFFLLPLILLFACAQFVPVTGGAIDKKGPTIINSNPADKTINFKGNTLSIEFDEFIDISGVKQELFIIPDPKSQYNVKLKDKTIKLTFDKKFEDSTTYTFNFRNGIKDLNEKNPAKNLKLVISTGPSIDSLSISGKVLDIHSKTPILDATVGLYRKDTIPLNKKKPDYFIKTDTLGNYEFTNIKNNKYFVLAFTDKNSNLIYDQKGETIGFLKDTLTLNKNITLPPIELYTANYSKNKIKKVISRENEFLIQFDKNFKEVKIDKALDFNSNKNQITIFKPYGENISDTLLLNVILKDSLNLIDTLKQKIYFNKVLKSSSKKKQTLSISSTVKSGQELTKYINYDLNFEFPIVRFDSSKIKFKTDTTFNKEKPKLVWVTKTKLNVQIETKAKNQIELTLPSNSFENIKGDTNSLIILKNIILQSDELGTLEGKTKDITSNKIVQLINEDTGNIGMEQKFKEKFKFNNIIPANYIIKIIIDENNNEIWDPGNIATLKMPEQILISKEAIRIRPNFELKDIFIE